MVVTRAGMEKQKAEDGPLYKLGERMNKIAHSKGWYIGQRTFGDITALLHSEITEAFEEYRSGHRPLEVYAGDKTYSDPEDTDWDELEILASHGVKPEGISIELADEIIRLLDFCVEQGIDIDRAVQVKAVYNETRTYRHGGKTL